MSSAVSWGEGSIVAPVAGISRRGDWFTFRQHPGEAVAAEDVIEDHDNRHAGRNCVLPSKVSLDTT